MTSQLSPLSASVTRILFLSGFPSELKTRDIQAAFSEWENVNGGFKIKWRDDTSLLIVFADPSTAKRAYLQTLASPPAIFTSPTSSKSATIRPYDGTDAQSIIQAVNARSHTSRGGGGGHRVSASVGGVPNRKVSITSPSIPDITTPILRDLSSPIARDHSPTLPNVPAHPTLSSLISLSLPSEANDILVPTPSTSSVTTSTPSPESNLAELQQGVPSPQQTAAGTPPRIGDPGRRMVGHALGIRHPSLASNRPHVAASPPKQQQSVTADLAMKHVQQAMNGLGIAE